MPSPENLAVIAAAGSHKTEYLVTEACSHPDRRILLTTYTNENLDCIQRRVFGRHGSIPSNVTIMTWYQFLAAQWCRPYQRAILGKVNFIRGVDFQTKRPIKIPEAKPLQYYVNRRGDLYQDWVAAFAVKVSEKTDAAPVHRLEGMFDEIYIDEVQDLNGYDLDILDLLLQSEIRLVMVGDPRQSVFTTNTNRRNKRYKADGLLEWFKQRESLCAIETRSESFRCNQAICDFADALYPELERTTSLNTEEAVQNGIFFLNAGEVQNYVQDLGAVVLRYNRTVNSFGLPAVNFGAIKGATFDHVVIIPTGDMKTYLENHDPSILKPATLCRFYVAVTRAKHSVAFVV